MAILVITQPFQVGELMVCKANSGSQGRVKTLTKYQPSGALAHRLQCRTACQWAPKWPTGSTPSFLGILSNFR